MISISGGGVKPLDVRPDRRLLPWQETVGRICVWMWLPVLDLRMGIKDRGTHTTTHSGPLEQSGALTDWSARRMRMDLKRTVWGSGWFLTARTPAARTVRRPGCWRNAGMYSGGYRNRRAMGQKGIFAEFFLSCFLFKTSKFVPIKQQQQQK